MATHSADWFDAVPKVELHVHLEGAIPLPALAELARKYGERDAADVGALRERFRYRDFPHFIDVWVWKNGLLRELDDFAFVAEAVARDLRAQHVLYAEAFYSPPDFAKRGFEVGEITAAVRAGLDRVDGIELRLVADLVRDFGPVRAARALEEVAEVRGLGVIGIGIGGSEHEFPPGPFAEVFERVRELGFRTSAHAGEAAGPGSVRGAVEVLRVDRVGHATRAAEDQRLVAELEARRIPLEMCPISNVRTRVVPDLAAHPVRDFFDRGLLVTVNTDDPAMFQTSLAHEYRELVRVHGFTFEEIRKLVENAVAASWLAEDGKKRLLAGLRAEPGWTPT
ncbi:MAG: adenosine deaminase [Proteobacteria bacterium]|jgi:adenosine deaminase|nr:adenosine deaminase [Pseudomonadota bacterium]